jgi:hypothetical protein
VSERCFVKVRWDPATTPGDVRRAVGGFLRYIQHRDLHPDSSTSRKPSEVAGLLKYVAYRDRASSRAELLGPEGPISSQQRKDFAEYVARSIAGSAPQLYRGRDGRLLDRRRAVSRFVISPERAQGLDLEQLLRAGVACLEAQSGLTGLCWIAAIHRNTKHHHLHLVLAGLHLREDGSYVRVDITKHRLAALKEAVIQEIERQRGARELETTNARQILGGSSPSKPALMPMAVTPRLIRTPPRVRPALRGIRPSHRHHRASGDALSTPILRLRAAARRYQRRMQRETEEEARRLAWERGR